MMVPRALTTVLSENISEVDLLLAVCAPAPEVAGQGGHVKRLKMQRSRHPHLYFFGQYSILKSKGSLGEM